ncbi:response regulator [Aestuariibacter sp. AA17]|uniref:histidine kinase n=1 Tax=Fluctibacter corallii TaxID=2984329 RepID=A0ABT3A7Q8_9ALTE|nr:hybrid sensor histidine kinase/response regulator transcription factor [Aestuariibacter sp. AA17]MCV2884317.1 response regulator [Aestuariibacter sp. AA17]
MRIKDEWHQVRRFLRIIFITLITNHIALPAIGSVFKKGFTNDIYFDDQQRFYAGEQGVFLATGGLLKKILDSEELGEISSIVQVHYNFLLVSNLNGDVALFQISSQDVIFKSSVSSSNFCHSFKIYEEKHVLGQCGNTLYSFYISESTFDFREFAHDPLKSTVKYYDISLNNEVLVVDNDGFFHIFSNGKVRTKKIDLLKSCNIFYIKKYLVCESLDNINLISILNFSILMLKRSEYLDSSDILMKANDTHVVAIGEKIKLLHFDIENINFEDVLSFEHKFKMIDSIRKVFLKDNNLILLDSYEGVLEVPTMARAAITSDNSVFSDINLLKVVYNNSENDLIALSGGKIVRRTSSEVINISGINHINIHNNYLLAANTLSGEVYKVERSDSYGAAPVVSLLKNAERIISLENSLLLINSDGYIEWYLNDSLYTNKLIELSDMHIFDALKLENSLFFVTQKSGILEYHESSDSWTTWSIPGALTTITNCMIEDASGVIWICTDGKGLGYLDKATQSVVFIDSQFTGNSLFIRDAVEDTQGYLWLMTNTGLVRYDHKNQTTFKFGPEESIDDTDFEIAASINLADDQILVAGDQNNYKIDTRKMNAFVEQRRKHKYKALMVGLDITSRNSQHSVSEDSRLSRAIYEKLPLEFDYSEYIFQLEFASNSFLNSRILGFEYRLKGLTDAWTKATPEQSQVTFSTLPSGKYQFEVRVHDPKSFETQPITSVNIVVHPPFWLTWQAYLLYCITFLLLVWAGYQYRVKKLAELNDDLQRQVVKQSERVIQSNKRIKAVLNNMQHLFANVSHELRTPLSLIAGPLELVEDAVDTSKVKKEFDIIERNKNKLNELIDQLLAISKLNLSTFEGVEKIVLSDTVPFLVEPFSTLAKTRGMKLKFDANLCHATTYLTPGALDSVVNNLLSNAVKYGEEHSTITVFATCDEDKFTFSVHNVGEPLSPEQLDMIFNRFVRLERHEQVEGEGLGLSILNEIVLANGGKMSATSNRKTGTVFEVQLSLIDLDEEPSLSTETVCAQPKFELEPATSEVEIAPATSDDKRPHVLIVDDSHEMANFLQRALGADFACTQASNGHEAFQLAKQLLPDLILTDLMMPLVDGVELLKLVRSDENLSHIAVILMTAKEGDESRINAWSAYADDFVPKPFKVSELKLRLQRTLKLREALKRRYTESLDIQIEDKTNDEFTLHFSHPKDQAFYDNFIDVIANNYSDERFNRKAAADAMAVSERQLNRRLGSLIEYNFTEILRAYRLVEAKKLLREGKQIAETSYQVGFSSPSYFTNCFKQRFGVTPSQFVAELFAA